MFADAADLPNAGQHHKQGANSRRVKDMVSQPKQKTGAGRRSECASMVRILKDPKLLIPLLLLLSVPDSG